MRKFRTESSASPIHSRSSRRDSEGSGRGGEGERGSSRRGRRRESRREGSTDHPPGRRGWFGFGLLALIVLGGPLVWLLATAGPEFQTHGMERWSREDKRFLASGCALRSLPMERRAEVADGFVHTLTFAETDGMPREGLRSIELAFDVRKPDDLHSEEKRITRLVRGEIRDLETGEVWTARPIRWFRTEDRVAFERARGGEVARGEAVMAGSTNLLRGWSVTLWTHDPVTLAVRCHLSEDMPDGFPPPHPGEWAFRVPTTVGKVQWAYPHGRYTTWTEGKPMSRARVVGAAWDRNGAQWVWGWIALALGMVVAGVAGMAGRVDSGLPVGSWRTGLSLGLVFGGIGLVQMILRPAGQGIDERATIQSWLAVANDEARVAETSGLLRRVHYDRLMARPHQQLTTADVGRPDDFQAESVGAMGSRPLMESATGTRVSRILQRWVSGVPPAVQVFRMRLAGLMLVSLSVVLAGALLARGAGAQAGEHWLGWCLVMVPSLGHFATGGGVDPILLGCVVVLGAALASMVNRADQSWRVMLVVGWTLGMLVHTSMVGVLTGVAVAAALLGQALFRFKDSTAEASDRPAAAMGAAGWGGLAIGLLLSRVVSSDGYDAAVGTMVRSLWGWSWLPPYWLVVVVACGGLWVVEWVAVALKWLSREGHGRRPLWLQMLALSILLGLLWNTFRTAPRLGMLTEAVPAWEILTGRERLLPPIGLPVPAAIIPSTGVYVLSLVESFLASWGPGDADHLTSVLFWQMGGSPETLMPSWTRQCLTTFLACGLALSLWRISERRNWGRFGRLVMALVGVAGALILLTLGSRSAVESPSFHGRHLLGVYVLLIPLMFLGWKGLMVRWESTSPRKLAFVLVVPMLLFQTAAIVTTIHRYFG
jgi:hypothetical protein